MRIFLLGLVVVLFSCEPKHESTTPIVHEHDGLSHSHSYDHERPAPDKGRFAWQKPSLIIDKLGDLEGKTVADIGAGTGYFTFRLLRKADKVIAIDIDEDMIELMSLFGENLDSLQRTKLDLRLALPNNPKLEKDEVDVVLIINTIGYIADRSAYLNNLLSSLKSGGQLMIVDYKMKRIPADIAPDANDRITMLELETTLEDVGYQSIKTDDSSLEYQFIITASKE